MPVNPASSAPRYGTARRSRNQTVLVLLLVLVLDCPISDYENDEDERFAGPATIDRTIATPLEVPKSLVGMEAGSMAERTIADLKARGVNPEQVPIDQQAFEGAARRRVALGLIINELKGTDGINPKPAEVRALVEQEAQSYERPAEVVKWFYMQRERLAEMESLALETNVVKWVLTKAKVLDKPVTFDELMGGNSS